MAYHNQHNYFHQMCQLGWLLYSGEKEYSESIQVNNSNYLALYHSPELKKNIQLADYFQEKDICILLKDKLQEDEMRNNIIHANPFKDRYLGNNDCFVHIRLGDVPTYNPGVQYYLHALSLITFDRLYICSDSPDHGIIQQLRAKYPELEIKHMDEVQTIQFGSTAKHVILSHGSFSAIIGYLSFYSDVYYPKYEKNKIWYGDMFSIAGWNEIDAHLEKPCTNDNK